MLLTTVDVSTGKEKQRTAVKSKGTVSEDAKAAKKKQKKKNKKEADGQKSQQSATSESRACGKDKTCVETTEPTQAEADVEQPEQNSAKNAPRPVVMGYELEIPTPLPADKLVVLRREESPSDRSPLDPSGGAVSVRIPSVQSCFALQLTLLVSLSLFQKKRRHRSRTKSKSTNESRLTSNPFSALFVFSSVSRHHPPTSYG